MGEFELLARMRERLPPAAGRVKVGMGDDAAVTVPGGATATSVDAIVEGVHFRREHSSSRQIGRKAIATALSDLAAMGAEPGEAYAVLGAPPDLDEDGCLELFDGVAELAAATGTILAGGDLTRSPALTVTIAVVGHAPGPERLVTRAGAQPGDQLVLTGELGGAAAGLLILERPELAAGIAAETVEALCSRQLDPSPRLVAGRALADAGVRAMIDLSDGLGGDAGHLAERSGVGLRIEAAALPLAAGVAEVAGAAGEDPLRLAASGGEDYELLAAIPPDRVDLGALAEAAGVPLTRVGEAVEGEGAEIRLRDGRALDPGGYDQLR
jgi:thiamine-monophosphate kinase